MNEFNVIGDDGLIVDSDILCATPGRVMIQIQALAEVPSYVDRGHDNQAMDSSTHRLRDSGYACAGPAPVHNIAGKIKLCTM